MPKLHERIDALPTDKLLVVLEFFDCPALRRFYPGLIADIKRKLTDRGVKIPVRDASK
jgi:hypothetical protein